MMKNRTSSLIGLVLLIGSIWLVGGCALIGVADGYREPVEISGREIIAVLEEVAPNLETGREIIISQALYRSCVLDQAVVKIQEFTSRWPNCHLARRVHLVIAELYKLDCQIALGSAATHSDGYPPWFIIAFVYERGGIRAYGIDLSGHVWPIGNDCLLDKVILY